MGLFSKQTAISSQIDVITNLASITQWEQVTALCDAVNAKDDGAKEAAKALRKKLRLGKPQQQMNAITLIQAMVEGCGSRFKAQLATDKFVEDIRAVALSESTDVNVKICLMERLEGWADAFVSDPGLAIIPQLYQALCRNNTPRSANGARSGPPSPPRAPLTPEQRMRQMAQDIELARNNAHMLVEAVSFADPEVEAVEENELIKEFHSKCLTLQRGIQQYLSEMTESPDFSEQWLTSLLACNQELVQAFTAYNQMMERQHLARVTKASQLTDAPRSNGKQNPAPEDLISFNDGAGVGNRTYQSNGGNHVLPTSTTTAAVPQTTSVLASPPVLTGNHNGGITATESSADPFGDPTPYFVSGPNDAPSAVKLGKRTENNDMIFDASSYIRQQQAEQEQLAMLKEQQRQLHLQHSSPADGSSSSSSSSAAAIVAVEGIHAVAPPSHVTAVASHQ
ncbi:TOM1-like protein 2 [Lunasporangiospora selenospora]|uniref:TOM1-like protein 2 n=1 Tax=Lunasporangiospora selenospora TaxID=979761 RepID=A0A9P6FVU1_9FUNG|nr:TOM1-like protein 2 [Lunasporangiospora selenospora]